MPYTLDNPPDRIKNLSEHEQEIWIKAFNSALKEHDGDETIANKIAYAAVKKSKQNDTDHVSLNGGTKQNNKIERLGEDDHFVRYKVRLTTVGVMNRAHKPIEEIQAIPKNLPAEVIPCMPSTNDHPPKEHFKVEDTAYQCGFVTDITLDNSNHKAPVIWGVDHVPKSRMDIIMGIEGGKYNGGSIGYYADWIEQPGEWNGYNYNWIEKNIKIHHWARMIKGVPACPPNWKDGTQGCGYNKENENKKIKEIRGISMDKEKDNGKETTIKNPEENVTVKDMTVESIAEVNPKVKDKLNCFDKLTKKVNELEEKIKELEPKANKFDELAKKELEDARNKINEFDPKHEIYSEEEIKTMNEDQIKNILKLIESKKLTENTKTKAPPFATNNTSSTFSIQKYNEAKDNSILEYKDGKMVRNSDKLLD